MGIKQLFSDKYKVMSKQSISDITGSSTPVESSDYIEKFLSRKARYLPPIDFATASNFAKFGSAEQYATDAITRVHNTYPYDGSLTEKVGWFNRSNFYDLYLFNHRYPRTCGYASFSPDGWGTRNGAVVNTYGLPNSPEYIQIKGGPHRDTDTTKKLSRTFPEPWDGKANVWDSTTGVGRESNLGLDPDNGVTLEFWIKKPNAATVASEITALTSWETIFDIWNGKTGTSEGDTYGRFFISYIHASSQLVARFASGSFAKSHIIDSSIAAAVTDGKWHHVAITAKQVADGSNYRLEWNNFLDGQYVATDAGAAYGTKTGVVTGSMIANIGAFRIPAESQAQAAALSSGQRIDGYGKLSGSLDEFRYWKTARTAQQISRFWFTQIAGGTNTDESKFSGSAQPVDLGAYYKFNEGNTGVDATDKTVLDYSGRMSNGTWTGFISGSSRIAGTTSSAMVESSASLSEFRDPVIYSSHPDVQALSSSLTDFGRKWDTENSMALYHTMPEWITSEDREDGGETLKKLTQIISSYLDTMYLQIQAVPTLPDTQYPYEELIVHDPNKENDGAFDSPATQVRAYSNRPIPHAKNMVEGAGLHAPEIFAMANELAQLANRDEYQDFDQKLYDVKNTIYQNIYNNLVYIYKSKGTEKAFRNLIRCFGVDDELIKINLYTDGSTYLFDSSNYRSTSVKSKYIDFNNTDRNQSLVFQSASYSTPDSISYIPGWNPNNALTAAATGSGMTFQADVILPLKFDRTHPSNKWYYYPHLTSSMFGCHEAAPPNGIGSSLTLAGLTSLVGANGTTLILTNTDGAKHTFTTNSSIAYGSSTNIHIGTSGINSDSKATEALHVACAAAIAAGTLKMSLIPATFDVGVTEIITLTQSVSGYSGNKKIEGTETQHIKAQGVSFSMIGSADTYPSGSKGTGATEGQDKYFSWLCTGRKASATISGLETLEDVNGTTIRLTNADGDPHEFTTTGGMAYNVGSAPGGYAVGTQGADTAAKATQALHIAFTHAIRNGTLKMSLTPKTYTNETSFTVTQDLPGSVGNTAIGAIPGIKIGSGADGAGGTFSGGVSDNASFDVYTLRPKEDSKDARFMLSSSNPDIPTLTTSQYTDVYNNERWMFSVKVQPTSPLESQETSGSVASVSDDWEIVFQGCNPMLDQVQDTFTLSGNIPCPHATATVEIKTATVTDIDGEYIILTSTDGTVRKYVWDDSGDVGKSTGTVKTGTEIWVQINGLSAEDTIAAQLQAAIEAATAHAGKISVSRADEVLTLTQTLSGPEGNKTFTSDSAASHVLATHFTGGAFSQASQFMNADKRVYAGALRTNSYANTVIDKYSDVKVGTVRVWDDALSDYEFSTHAKDPSSHGRERAYKSAYLFNQEGDVSSGTGSFIPQFETLLLNWTFADITGSTNGAYLQDHYGGSSWNSSFEVLDYSSGSDAKWEVPDRYKHHYTGRGDWFLPNDTGSVDLNFLSVVKTNLPEVMSGEDMISILTTDDNYFTRDSVPVNHYFAIEKSMYQSISEEMLSMFASTMEFNNLVGEPVNRYRQEYKALGKLREAFFRKVGNTPDFNKFVNFYKWIDDSLTVMLMQLVPMTANFSPGVKTMVESHILERNKYWTKFPTLEMKAEDPTGYIRGIKELTYDWEHGHPAPDSLTLTGATLANAIDTTGVNNDHTFTLTSPTAMGGDGVTYTFKFVHDTTAVNNGAAGNIYYIARDGLTDAQRAAACADAINGVANANAGFSDGNVSSVNSVDLKIIATAPGTGGGATIDLEFANKGEVGNGHANVLAGTNGFAGTKILEAAFTGGADSQQNINCLWWKERSEASASPTHDASIDTDRNTLRRILTSDITTNKILATGEYTDPINYPNSGFPNAAQFNLSSQGTSLSTRTQYKGSTYALRRFSKPYRMEAEETVQIHGGINYHANKRRESFKARIVELGSTVDGASAGNWIQGFPALTDDLLDCDDVLNPSKKEFHSFTLDSDGVADDFQKLDGVRHTPFNLVSSSLENTSNYGNDNPQLMETNISLVNLHTDAYGDSNEVPMQGPFTHKYVGGMAHRHQGISDGTNTSQNRTENFRVTNVVKDVQFALVPGNTDEAGAIATHYPFDRFYRDGTAKRPVNIRNIKSQAREEHVQGSGLLAEHNWISHGPFIRELGIIENYGWITVTGRGRAYLLSGSYIDDSELTDEPRAPGDTPEKYRYVETGATFNLPLTVSWEHINGDVTIPSPDKAGAQGGFLLNSSETAQHEHLWVQYSYDRNKWYDAVSYFDADSSEDKGWIPFTVDIDDGTNRPVALRWLSGLGADAPSNDHWALADVRIISHPNEVGTYETPFQFVSLHNDGTAFRSKLSSSVNSLYDTEQPVASDNVSDTYDYSKTLAVGQTLLDSKIALTPPYARQQFNPFRTRHKITERFSAPGGPDTAGDAFGGFGLDRCSNKYSVYNALTWRNLAVRTPLNAMLNTHAGKYGSLPLSNLSSADGEASTALTASYHQTPRNVDYDIRQGVMATPYHTSSIYFGPQGANGPAKTQFYRDNAAVVDNLTQQSLSIWLMMPSSDVAGENVLFSWSDGGYGAWLALSTDGDIVFQVHGATGNHQWRSPDGAKLGWFSDNTGLYDAQWHHIVFSFDQGGDQRWREPTTSIDYNTLGERALGWPNIWFDGVQQPLTYVPAAGVDRWAGLNPAITDLGDVCIGTKGKGNTASSFDGYLQHISLWNSVLTRDQVQDLFHMPGYEAQGPGDLRRLNFVSTDPQANKLVAWWKFDRPEFDLSSTVDSSYSGDIITDHAPIGNNLNLTYNQGFSGLDAMATCTVSILDEDDWDLGDVLVLTDMKGVKHIFTAVDSGNDIAAKQIQICTGACSDIATLRGYFIIVINGQAGFNATTGGAANQITVSQVKHGGSGNQSNNYVTGDGISVTAFTGGYPTTSTTEYAGPKWYDTKCVAKYDNWFIQHPIPANDFGYAWITASADKSVGCDLVTTASFVTASLHGSYMKADQYRRFGLSQGDTPLDGSTRFGWIPTDFVGLNNNIYEPVNSDTNTLGYSSNFSIWSYVNAGPPGEATETDLTTFNIGEGFIHKNYMAGLAGSGGNGNGPGGLVNSINSHRGGVYGYPSWKQIRTGEHPVAREHKKNNILSVSDEPTTRTLTHGGTTQEITEMKASTHTNYVEPPVSFKHTSLVYRVGSMARGIPQNLTVQTSYANNLTTFANVELANRFSRQSPARQMYDDFKDMYLVSEESVAANPLKAFKSLVYRETIYPKGVNTFLSGTRSRLNYAETAAVISSSHNGKYRTFWRDDLTDRKRDDGAANSMGYPVFANPNQLATNVGLGHLEFAWILGSGSLSIWPLDVGKGKRSTESFNPALSGVPGTGSTDLTVDHTSGENEYGGTWGELQKSTVGSLFASMSSTKLNRLNGLAAEYTITIAASTDAADLDGDIIRLIDNNGTTKNYIFDDDDDGATGTLDGDGYTRVQLDADGGGGGELHNYPFTILAELKEAIEHSNGHDGDIIVDEPQGIGGNLVATLRLQQKFAGAGGNSIVTITTGGGEITGAGKFGGAGTFEGGLSGGSNDNPQPTNFQQSSYAGHFMNDDNFKCPGTASQCFSHFSLIPNNTATGGQTYNHAEAYPVGLPIRAGRGDGCAGLTPTNWTTNFWSGRNPWHDSYEVYSDDIRKMGQGYSVLPEFRISDHMDYYIENGFQDVKNFAFLSLDGGSVSSSADTPNGTYTEQFWKEYCHSDFLHQFDVIQKDHDGVAALSAISLKCSVIKKLLPYNGFYPVQRSLQLGSLLSSSYAPYLSGSSEADYGQEPGGTINSAGSNYDKYFAERLQSFLQPFYAPGIMYNSIKSGIAVDYPIHTSSAKLHMVGMQGAANAHSGTPTHALGSCMSISSLPDMRMPFEALINPDPFLPVSSSVANNRETVDPETAGRLYLTAPYYGSSSFYATWNGSSKPNYSMAANNFAAEVPNFFLKNKTLTTFRSAEESKYVPMASGSTYFMDVVLYQSPDMLMSWHYPGVNEGGRNLKAGSATGWGFGPRYSVQKIYDGANPTANTVYETDQTQNTTNTGCPGYAPHVPPYLYGRAVARLAFSPHKVVDMAEDTTIQFGVSDILTNIKLDDETSFFTELGAGQFPYLSSSVVALGMGEGAASHARMSVSSSINIYGRTETPSMEFDAVTRLPKRAMQTGKQSWVIHSKWECPTLNFANGKGGGLGPGELSSSMALTGSWWTQEFPPSEIDRPMEMWNGHGSIPTGETGIFFGIRESFPHTTFRGRASEKFENSGSLLQACGFRPEQRRVGELATGKWISEAIVAIPFTDVEGRRKFFALGNTLRQSRTLFNKALQGQAGPGRSIVQMASRMPRYVIPPHLDFIHNKSLEPFAMYIFEFSERLNQQDLSNIWQNVMPDIAVTAKKATTALMHNTGENEFFRGNKMPAHTRWMVFKVKRRAASDYFKLTADTADDHMYSFNFAQGNHKAIPDYTYNWPYDFFSLVELAKVDIKLGIGNDAFPVTPSRRFPDSILGPGGFRNLTAQQIAGSNPQSIFGPAQAAMNLGASMDTLDLQEAASIGALLAKVGSNTDKQQQNAAIAVAGAMKNMQTAGMSGMPQGTEATMISKIMGNQSGAGQPGEMTYGPEEDVAMGGIFNEVAQGAAQEQTDQGSAANQAPGGLGTAGAAGMETNNMDGGSGKMMAMMAKMMGGDNGDF